jgi:hypothetical protein
MLTRADLSPKVRNLLLDAFGYSDRHFCVGVANVKRYRHTQVAEGHHRNQGEPYADDEQQDSGDDATAYRGFWRQGGERVHDQDVVKRFVIVCRNCDMCGVIPTNH